MIDVTSEQIREIIADDIAAMRGAQETINAMYAAALGCEFAESDSDLLRMLDELPDKIASASPFWDQAHIYSTSMQAVREVLEVADRRQRVMVGMMDAATAAGNA